MKRADWHQKIINWKPSCQTWQHVDAEIRIAMRMLDKFVEMAEWYEDEMKWDDSVGNLSDKARQVLEAYEKGSV